MREIHTRIASVIRHDRAPFGQHQADPAEIVYSLSLLIFFYLICFFFWVLLFFSGTLSHTRVSCALVRFGLDRTYGGLFEEAGVFCTGDVSAVFLRSFVLTGRHALIIVDGCFDFDFKVFVKKIVLAV